MKINLAFLAFSLLILFGFTVSGYLLWQHLELVYLGGGAADICSVVFGTGCDAALSSPLSEQLGIPLGGWGMIYYGLLAALLFLGFALGEPFRSNAGKAGWGLVLAGAGISLLLLISFLFNPALFCPLCTLIHGINLLLIIPARRLTRADFASTASALKEAGRFLFSGKSEHPEKARYQAVAFTLILFFGLSLYQWVQLQESAYREAAQAAYIPEGVIEEYMAQPVRSIRIDSGALSAGPPDAAVQMVVFSDFQCPACRDFSKVETYLFQLFSDRMQITFKHFPLSNTCNPAAPSDLHPQACAAARSAQAAARQDQFWPYHDALFSIDLENATEEDYFDIARRLGLDEALFKKDFTSEAVAGALSADIEEGRRLDLRGTPAVFLNGRRVTDLSPRSLSLLITFLYYEAQ